MNGFLLDTNCISELVRLKPEPRVIKWLESTDERMLYLSVLTLGEIRKGLAVLSQSNRRTKLETWMELELKPRFAGRLLSIDDRIADRWGLLAARARNKGRTLAVIDGLIAATALHHDLTILTRNVDDFEIAQVSILNPWKL